VRAVGVSEGEPDPGTRGGFVGEPLHAVGHQFEDERVRIAEQVNAAGRAGEQGYPQVLRDIRAVRPGADDFSSGLGSRAKVGAGLWPQVGLGFAEQVRDGQPGALAGTRPASHR